MDRVEQLISEKTLASGKFLVDFLKLSSQNHILEKKKLSNYSAELLVASLTITIDTETC